MQVCRTASAYPEISQVALHGVLLVAEAEFIYRQIITQVLPLHLMQNERKAGYFAVTGVLRSTPRVTPGRKLRIAAAPAASYPLACVSLDL